MTVSKYIFPFILAFLLLFSLLAGCGNTKVKVEVQTGNDTTAAPTGTTGTPEETTSPEPDSPAEDPDATDPAEDPNPSTPDAPSDPTEPVTPDPTVPDVEPTTPSTPTDPTTPQDPSTPTTPADPSTPTTPADPTTPTTPADPTTPTTPQDPSTPTTPTTPSTPTTPTTPVNPDDPTTTPTTPVTPPPVEPDDTYVADDLTFIDNGFGYDYSLDLNNGSFVVYNGNIPVELVTFTSSNETVCTFKSGVAYLHSAGMAQLTATYKDLSIVANIRVVSNSDQPDNPQTLTFSNTVISAVISDKTVDLTALYNGTVDIKSITWESSNTAVCTVKDGVVTLVAAGEATITASSAGMSVDIKISVKRVSGAVGGNEIDFDDLLNAGRN